MMLLPCRNCKVVFNDKPALVVGVRYDDSDQNIIINLASGKKAWVALSAIKPGYQIGDYVIHCPPKSRSTSMGVGVVEGKRQVVGYDQLLVQFAETGKKRWLDWRVLAHAHPVEIGMKLGRCGKFDNHAERTRLRILSKGLKIWDATTGAFGRLDIDPLPHQLDVAKKVISSPQARWLLADDVGLGKTIEVGLIIHALTQRDRCRRVLIVCPSSLTKQWREEMRFKFSRFFEIYGQDFRPEYPEQIKLRDNVIVSLDLAKKDKHLNLLLQSGGWDVIVFDEAHRLGVAETGQRTERYKLAKELHQKAPNFLLLTATPHQGKTRRFRALLELVRPDLLQEVKDLEFHPEVIKDLIIRNKKTKVTDADGNFIFRGHDTQRLMAKKEQEMRDADSALRQYLRSGYNVSQKSPRNRAIGFVMTTYRKLASSSVAAIEVALTKRHQRLIENAPDETIEIPDSEELEGDDTLATNEMFSSLGSFFEDELNQIEDVLCKIRASRTNDRKLKMLIEEILTPLFEQGESVLIFTEYRATQEYLLEQIALAFPNIGECSQIHGSMSLEQKIHNIRLFNEGETKVLVSTEAGGEGLNLQESCHIMINYDLPWNPSRLVQRIGRLYRYGQQKRVQVINIQSDDGFDNQALSLMLDRVSVIANEMASVDEKSQEGLADEILGELLSQIDMAEILERSTTLNIARTEAEIAEAIKRAEEARKHEEDILQFSNSYTSKLQGGFTNMHMVSFVEGMCDILGIKIRQKLHNNQTLEIELPEDQVGRWPEFRQRKNIRLSVDRRRLQASDGLIPMDFECNFVLDLSRAAGDRWKFDGLYGFADISDNAEAIVIQDIIWQGLAGEKLEEELLPAVLSGNTWSVLEHEKLAELLLMKWPSAKGLSAKIEAETVMNLHEFIEKELTARANYDKTPMISTVYSAVKFPEN